MARRALFQNVAQWTTLGAGTRRTEYVGLLSLVAVGALPADYYRVRTRRRLSEAQALALQAGRVAPGDYYYEQDAVIPPEVGKPYGCCSLAQAGARDLIPLAVRVFINNDALPVYIAAVIEFLDIGVTVPALTSFYGELSTAQFEPIRIDQRLYSEIAAPKSPATVPSLDTLGWRRNLP